MKKLFFLFVIMLACMNVSSFGQTRRDEITVDGFDGDKPLKENSVVIVNYPEKGMQGIWEDAYKGETRKSFLKRINSESSLEARKPSAVKKISNKEEDILLAEPISYRAVYRKNYASNNFSPKKRELLSLEEFSDSIMMDTINKETESKTSDIKLDDVSAKDKVMTQERSQIIILFIFCLILFFFLFSKIPLLWRRKK